MADNSTQGGSDTIRDIEKGVFKTQVFILDIGGTGEESILSAANPLPITLASIFQKNVASQITDKGILLLAQRRDSDTAETTGDGQYTSLKQDQAGRLKVATQPGDVVATVGSITASTQTVSIQTTRISNLSIAMVATSLVGHNCIFEVSNDSTDGANGNWKTVQAIRTDSNLIETTTGVLSTTPVYAWELNVAAYAYFRIRCTAHTSGTASYTLKPGAYATEPIPGAQNPALVLFPYSLAGVIAINTDLIVIDCINFKSLSIQCLAMGTSGVVTVQWANDAAFTTPVTATLVSEAGAISTTFNAACLRNTNVLARYCRLRLTTAATAGTTTINVQASQACLVPVTGFQATQPVSLATNTPIPAAGTNLSNDVGVQYRANATGGASVSKFTSAATANAAFIKASAGRVVGWSLTNNTASIKYFRFFNLTVAPTMGTSSPYFVIAIPANGQAVMPVGAGSIAFATGIAIACTGAAADLDTTVTAANDVMGAIFYA